MKKLLSYAALCLLLSGCSLWEDNPEGFAVADADIPLAVLIGKMQTANDPRGICRSADSYVLRQQMEREGDETDQQYQVEVKFQKKPYFSKTTVLFKDKPQSVTLFDGVNAWSIDSASGVSTPLTGARLKTVQALSKIGNPSYTYTDIFAKIELAQLVSGTKEYYRLICIAADNEIPPLTIFVDKNSFLTRKVSLTFKSMNGGGEISYVSFINKYSLISGVMMPEVMTVENNGVKYQYKTVEFKLNVKFMPSEFTLPTPWYITVKPREAAAPVAANPAIPAAKPPVPVKK